MIRFSSFLAAILMVVTLSSCSVSKELYSESNFIFGTRVVISIYPVAGRNVKADLASLFSELKRFNSVFNPRKFGSLVRALNTKRQLVFNPNKGFKLLQALLIKSFKIATLSKGAFDPTIYALSKLWKFSEVVPLLKPPSIKDIIRATKRVNYLNLTISKDKFINLRGKSEIDLGGIAKGYAADLVAKKLKKWGYNSGIVYVGGDIALLGNKKNGSFKRKWEVGIQHPRLKKRYFCRLYLSELAVVTSGDYEKFFIYKRHRYHHLIDPKKGYPATGLVSCTVIGKKVADADGYATAIMVLGAKKGIEFINSINNYEAMVIKKENSQMKALFSKDFKRITGYKKEQL